MDLGLTKPRHKELSVQEILFLIGPSSFDGQQRGAAAVAAGKLLEDLPALWKNADLGERRRILLTMLDAVYVDTVEEKTIVAIRPKPAFRPLLEIATTRKESGIVLVNDKDLEEANQPPPGGHEADGSACSWWRRGRCELHLLKKFQKLLHQRNSLGVAL